jgi:hypothetical protein
MKKREDTKAEEMLQTACDRTNEVLTRLGLGAKATVEPVPDAARASPSGGRAHAAVHDAPGIVRIVSKDFGTFWIYPGSVTQTGLEGVTSSVRYEVHEVEGDAPRWVTICATHEEAAAMVMDLLFRRQRDAAIAAALEEVQPRPDEGPEKKGKS